MYQTFEELENSIIGCKKCRLCENRTNIVFGTGNKQADVMFIGEGPGADEDMSRNTICRKSRKVDEYGI